MILLTQTLAHPSTISALEGAGLTFIVLFSKKVAMRSCTRKCQYKFKETTGLTPMNYLKIYRVEEAYKLIKEGKRDIGNIAALCGFPDANYFTRCFKAHFGVPPSYFIRSKRIASK
ncbi:MAG: helix-turn-helix transcriptional regulator [Lachnospiraceae bacterium]|nr:helix-turn-helix transcriptional regulator [Lachnospiraceae bacterium]